MHRLYLPCRSPLYLFGRYDDRDGGGAYGATPFCHQKSIKAHYDKSRAGQPGLLQRLVQVDRTVRDGNQGDQDRM